MQPGFDHLTLRLAGGAAQAVTGTAAHPANGTLSHGASIDPGGSVIWLDAGVEFDRASAPASGSLQYEHPGGSRNVVGPLTVTVTTGATIHFGYK